MYVFYCKF